MSVGDGPRTGDETRRFRAFYDHAAPVEFDAVLPDNLDGPEDERQFLLDEAPFVRQAAVRVEPVVLPAGVTPGATISPSAGLGQGPSGNDGSGDLRGRTQMHHRQAGDLTSRGWRPVVEDDTTVERVGQVIMHALARGAGEDYDSPKAAWSEVGRAAVRALREDT